MKKKMTLFSKNQLDEMQELTLLRIESRGFWIGFWGLVLSLVLQVAFAGSGEGFRAVTGEFIVLIGMALYTAIACIRRGIWDRHIPATAAANIACSLLASTVTALFFSLLDYRNYQSLSGAAIVFAIHFVLLSVGLIAALTICTALIHKRRAKLDAEEAGNNAD